MTDEPNVTRGYGLLEGFLAKKRARVANSLIPPELRAGRILDIGCGTVPYFLLNTQFAERYGLDKVAKGGERAVAVGGAIILANFDIEREERAPFNDNYFDVVTMLAVFEHILPERLPAVAAEIRRILRPGGIYILTTPAWWTDGLLRFMARLRLVSPAEIEEHKDGYSPEKISSVLRQGGFAAKDIRTGYFELGMNIWATAGKPSGSPL
ncbi:MAG TPA: class I SAM-dependent methyltransferase [Syntrophorhabdaceae bacterium]|nr:class I SAM-dependent methyltransferase [Syntrophorhabdaceae bacterium]HQM82431.1 class I SAM-dependent methyltransferase [Syntrophorhabdaceae bacterium]